MAAYTAGVSHSCTKVGIKVPINTQNQQPGLIFTSEDSSAVCSLMENSLNSPFLLKLNADSFLPAINASSPLTVVSLK